MTAEILLSMGGCAKPYENQIRFDSFAASVKILNAIYKTNFLMN